MKRSGLVVLAVLISLGLTISGCSSAQKKLSEDVKGIQTKVDTLETRVEGVETKQAENERLAMEQAQRLEEMKARKAPKSNIMIKERRGKADKSHIKEIQACLKNAGFYHGEVDGVKGRKTRSAIRKFQEANGLAADGVVGKRTWQALCKYSAGAPAENAAQEEASTK